MTVVGIDLSLTATGMSDGMTTWLVKSAGNKGDTLAQRRARLVRLRSAIADAVPDDALVLVEAPAFSRQMGHMHDRSGLWWLVVSRLLHRGLDVVEVSPTSLKKYATGKGNANKGAMIEATTRRFPAIETAGDDNRCDALWLVAMGLDHLGGSPVVPALNRTALDAVRWPELVMA